MDLEDISYDLELESLVEEIISSKYEKVLLQFPDGFKQYGKLIVDFLEKRCEACFFIYFGTCFGACDVPLHLKEMSFDLIVQWGHNEFVKTFGW